MRSPFFFPLACVAAVATAVLTPGSPIDASAAQATAAGLVSVVRPVVPAGASRRLDRIFVLPAG